jgi:hypothetical protein
MMSQAPVKETLQPLLTDARVRKIEKSLETLMAESGR